MLDYQHIKKLAADAGFDLCGLTPCGHMAQNEAWLRAWLGKGYQSSLTYMERNVEKRADPRKVTKTASAKGIPPDTAPKSPPMPARRTITRR